MDNLLCKALEAINVAALEREEWLYIGMAIKAEGGSWQEWEEWSRSDSTRYHKGECERLWNGFTGSGITGGTIMEIAKRQGYEPHKSFDQPIEWDGIIEYDGIAEYSADEVWNPANDLLRYLTTLFQPEDIVGYVTNDVWQNEDGRWLPKKGVFDRTAGELIASLQAHPDDIGATIGDWNKEAGAWIRFNPLTGNGVKNDDVAAYRYALVESDELPIEEQNYLFRKLELPIACLVSSGGKSLHAIVKVDAKDKDEYKKRVEYLYDYMAKNDVPIDKQNSNPSRLSRMPGVTRNGKRQYLIDTNIGRRNWDDWKDFAEGTEDQLPEVASLSAFMQNPLPLPEAIIDGILRKGHKMLISGSSKAGKSFLLMELCAAFAAGQKWLGFQCKQSRVLYVNLEIDAASFGNRFLGIYQALSYDPATASNIEIWNLRGFSEPLNDLVPKLNRRIKQTGAEVVIIDPIYKVITGDENNASEMGKFCNQFDRIATETGASIIYCHHHSKGAQGAKKAIDRASGSGVFARDPDAQLDIIQLEMSKDVALWVADSGATAWQMEFSLREFRNPKPVKFWFEHPVHRLDEEGDLDKCYPEGSAEANLAKSSCRTVKDDRKDSLDAGFASCSENGVTASINDIAEYLDISKKSIYRYAKEFSDDYKTTGGDLIKISR